MTDLTQMHGAPILPAVAPATNPFASVGAEESIQNLTARWASRFMFAVCIGFTVIILALLVLVTGYLISIGASALNWHLFTRTYDPTAPDLGGMANGLQGTIILIFIASVVGIPFGMLAGIYLAEYETGSWLVTPARFICDVLTGVPSIVVGILGYELLVVPLGGNNGWAGALALAFIMVPIVARTTEEMLRLVPGSYREASIALGATKASTIWKVVLPSATGSVVTGVMLAIARVAGETAPLLFTALMNSYLPLSANWHFPFFHVAINQPFPSLTVQVYNYARDPDPAKQHMAWGGILVLIFLIFILNLAIRFFTRGRKA